MGRNMLAMAAATGLLAGVDRNLDRRRKKDEKRQAFAEDFGKMRYQEQMRMADRDTRHRQELDRTNFQGEIDRFNDLVDAGDFEGARAAGEGIDAYRAENNLPGGSYTETANTREQRYQTEFSRKLREGFDAKLTNILDIDDPEAKAAELSAFQRSVEEMFPEGDENRQLLVERAEQHLSIAKSTKSERQETEAREQAESRFIEMVRGGTPWRELVEFAADNKITTGPVFGYFSRTLQSREDDHQQRNIALINGGFQPEEKGDLLKDYRDPYEPPQSFADDFVQGAQQNAQQTTSMLAAAGGNLSPEQQQFLARQQQQSGATGTPPGTGAAVADENPNALPQRNLPDSLALPETRRPDTHYVDIGDSNVSDTIPENVSPIERAILSLMKKKNPETNAAFTRKEAEAFVRSRIQ